MKTFFANAIQTYVGVPIPSGSTCILTLSQDAVSLVGNVIAQTRYVIPIDATGSFSLPIWFTDELNPSNIGYRVQIQVPNVGIVYDQKNVPITGASFNLASYVPGSAGLASGVVLPVFETNGTKNAVQSLLNLVAGTDITLTADGAGGVTVAGNSTPFSKVVTKTEDYAVQASDAGTAFIFNIPESETLTLPAVAPVSGWNINVMVIGGGNLVISPNGLNLDGGAANQTIGSSSGNSIFSDGSNYFLFCGSVSAGTQGQIAVYDFNNNVGGDPLLTDSGIVLGYTGTGGILLPATAPLAFGTAQIFKMSTGSYDFGIGDTVGDIAGTFTAGTLQAASAGQTGTYSAAYIVLDGDTYISRKASSRIAIGKAVGAGNGVITTNYSIANIYVQAGSVGSSGELILVGGTSGAATLTAPAVAGTITNPILISNSVQLPPGTALNWNADTGFSRGFAAGIYIGNGAAGDYSGSIYASTFGTGSSGVVLTGAGSAGTVSLNGDVFLSRQGSGAFRIGSTAGGIDGEIAGATAIFSGLGSFASLNVTGATATFGTAGATAGVITLEGSSSGSCTITAPAVAGTATNPIAFSNSVNLPSGTGLSWNNDTFISRSSANVLTLGNGIGQVNGELFTGTLSVSTAVANVLNVTGATATFGTAGATSGVLTLEGSTSGSCTITAPAVAGISTNPIVFSNAIQTPSGTAAAPTHNFSASANTGMYLLSAVGSPPSSGIGFSVNGVLQLAVEDNGIVLTGHFNNSTANSDSCGQISSVSGTTVSKIFASTYTSTPVVVVTPTTNAGAFYISAVSKTGFTVTYATSGAQTFNYDVTGNPN